MGSSLLDTIAFEQGQSNNKDEFLMYNSNYLWKKVKDTFESRTGSATVKCFEELLNIRLEEKENPAQFNQRFEAIIHRLNSIENDVILPGQRLSEGMKLALQIRALPKQYNVTVQAVIATQLAPTCNHLITALQRQHENDMSVQQKVKSSNHASLVSHDHQNKQLSSNRSTDKSKSSKDYHRKRDNNHSSSSRSTDKSKSGKGNHRTYKGDNNQLSSSESADESNSDNEGNDTFIFSALNSKQQIGDRELILDSASSRHVVTDRSILRNQVQESKTTIKSFTGHSSSTSGITGDIKATNHALISNVSHVPDAKYNLISLSQLLDAGAKVIRINKRSIVLRKVSPNQTRSKIIHFIRQPNSEDVWKLKLS